MKQYHISTISRVFTASAVVFVISLVSGAVLGGVGPCGPTNVFGLIGMLGIPLGVVGMIVGLCLTIVGIIFRRPKQPADKKPDEPV